MAVVLFHRVTDDIPEDSLTVSTSRFRNVCRMLRDNFNVVPLSEFFDALESRSAIKPRTIAITFDDCYRDNYFAARVLADFGLPACFFVPTAYVGTDHVFAWDRHLPQMPNLTWKEVHEIVDMGFEIGSHTVTHADLSSVSVEEARRELVESKKILESEFKRPVRWLAFPYGQRHHIPLDRLPLVHEAGYEGCLSAYGGLVYADRDDPVLPRVAIPPFKSLVHLELHLAGCMNWVYGLKRRAGFRLRSMLSTSPETCH